MQVLRSPPTSCASTTLTYVLIMDDELLRVGDPVMHKASRRVGTVERFAHNGTTDVYVDGTGPYPQTDFVKLTLPPAAPGEPGGPELADGSCTCRTFSECTHK